MGRPRGELGRVYRSPQVRPAAARRCPPPPDTRAPGCAQHSAPDEGPRVCRAYTNLKLAMAVSGASTGPQPSSAHQPATQCQRRSRGHLGFGNNGVGRCWGACDGP